MIQILEEEKYAADASPRPPIAVELGTILIHALRKTVELPQAKFLRTASRAQFGFEIEYCLEHVLRAAQSPDVPFHRDRQADHHFAVALLLLERRGREVGERAAVITENPPIHIASQEKNVRKRKTVGARLRRGRDGDSESRGDHRRHEDQLDYGDVRARHTS